MATNKRDYHPGEQAVIRGSGFLPGEPVRLQVLHTDGTCATHKRDRQLDLLKAEGVPVTGNRVDMRRARWDGS